MCYLIAKDFNKVGSIAMRHDGGKKLVQFERKLIAQIGYERIQLVTISRPNAYGEYAPYRFVDTEEEFENAVKSM